ncbi:MAG TPA: mycofactocin biosynthesis glycosyltransferase MftF, partial [Acidimicrobiales bacterium]|nr:mycofactocin biosynthesis glycosyltransferase MftF [Acidimicrobiales bacterium]
MVCTPSPIEPVPGPGALGVDPDAGLPVGFRIVTDPDTQMLQPGVLFGGSPARILRVNGPGTAALAALAGGPVRSDVEAAVARRLTDANLAQPLPPEDHERQAVTVVIPVRDRPQQLDRCLASLGGEHPVLVVDDGSAVAEETAVVCRRHGACLLRHETSRGPGSARNTGLAVVTTPLVAFVDSDCVPRPDWINGLVGHLADPLVACVAGRMVPLPAPAPTPIGLMARYAQSRLPLDLGPRPAAVAPGRRVAYVPSANLVARRAALGAGFDETLRYGEDVDLIWRLVEAGWRVRYEPAVEVPHEEPPSGWRLLRRRFEYGTSAGPLSVLHPGS